MKVRELIENLKEFDQKNEITIIGENLEGKLFLYEIVYDNSFYLDLNSRSIIYIKKKCEYSDNYTINDNERGKKNES